MNELFYSPQREFASRAAQIAPTWEDTVSRQAQASRANKCIVLKKGVISTTTSNPALDEDKNVMECNKMPLVLEGELQEHTLFEKNELAIDEEPSLKEKQVEKKHSELIIENVLVGVEDLNFPINSLTFGMEENQQVSFIERPSIAKSQVWIESKHGEMTFLAGEEKMKFDLHQRTPLTDEERKAFKKLESSFPLIKEQAPKVLQEETLEGYKLDANSFPTKELAFELTTLIPEVEEVILTSDEDEEGVLATIDEGPN